MEGFTEKVYEPMQQCICKWKLQHLLKESTFTCRECLRLSRRNQQCLTNRQFYQNVGEAGLVKVLKYYYYY